MGVIIFYLLCICLLTCIAEMIPLLFLKKRKKWIKTSLLCNVITNPIVNLLFYILANFIESEADIIAVIVVLEIAVILFEAFIFYNVMEESAKKCVIVSIVINTFSFLFGIVLFITVLSGGNNSHTSLPNSELLRLFPFKRYFSLPLLHI